MSELNYLEIYKTLGDRTRFRILSLLLKTKDELCCCDFSETFKITTYNICKHMKILKKEGLVKERKEGRCVFYKISKDTDSFIKSIFESVQNVVDSTVKSDLKSLLHKQKVKCECNSKGDPK